MAHRGHAWRGEAALEGPAECRLEGQDIIPLATQPQATGGLYQVSPESESGWSMSTAELGSTAWCPRLCFIQNTSGSPTLYPPLNPAPPPHPCTLPLNPVFG